MRILFPDSVTIVKSPKVKKKKKTILKTILKNGSHGSLFHSKQVIRSRISHQADLSHCIPILPGPRARAQIPIHTRGSFLPFVRAYCSRGTRSGWLEYIIEWESESEMKAKQKFFSDRNGK